LSWVPDGSTVKGSGHPDRAVGPVADARVGAGSAAITCWLSVQRTAPRTGKHFLWPEAPSKDEKKCALSTRLGSAGWIWPESSRGLRSGRGVGFHLGLRVWCSVKYSPSELAPSVAGVAWSTYLAVDPRTPDTISTLVGFPRVFRVWTVSYLSRISPLASSTFSVGGPQIPWYFSLIIGHVARWGRFTHFHAACDCEGFEG
jgi:hypothetical protein